jgi:hypothetical protein
MIAYLSLSHDLDLTGLPRYPIHVKIISKPVAECKGEKVGVGEYSMKAAALIFPHQLLGHPPALSKERMIFLIIEDPEHRRR